MTTQAQATASIGHKFFVGKQEFEVSNVVPFDPELTAIIKMAEKTGKEPVQYFASKVLKSGKKSKQGGMFYRFKESGNFVKVM